jgi:hypothetical protein
MLLNNLILLIKKHVKTEGCFNAGSFYRLVMWKKDLKSREIQKIIDKYQSEKMAKLAVY